MTPYYQQDGITVYHGDWRDTSFFTDGAPVLVTDPPYGIAYRSGRYGVLPRSIQGDENTRERDECLAAWGNGPALVFGTWRVPRPAGTRMLLVWDTMGALGMGDLSLPWKPSHQEIYVLGSGFAGPRTTDVLTFPPVQSTAANGRLHPHQKPVDLMRALIKKCPPGVIVDPFMGSGTTLRAAKDLGRQAIGIEIKERYCEVAVQRLAQGVLVVGGAPDA